MNCQAKLAPAVDSVEEPRHASGLASAGDRMKERGTSLEAPARLAPDIEAWLRAGAGAGAPCETVIETSISWVFLFPDRALKLKKPIDLGFLDFTSVEKRRWATERELAFNRPTAPDIYRTVHAVTRDDEGNLALDGSGEPADWALEMRRFDDTAMLSNRLSAVDGAFAEDLGRTIARYHLQASPGAAGGGARGLKFVLDSNAHLLRGETAQLGGAEVERLIAASEQAFDASAPLLDRRQAAGFVRCCHGDLHLGNILLEGGAPILFDCIEFNDALREIDVLYDIAFLLMDLWFRDAPEAANRVLNGWLDEAARGLSGEMWEGLAALPLFQAVRATVRAHVNALEGKVDEARRYLATAEQRLAPPSPVLLAIGGLSGSGKSTLARALAPTLGAPPGAVVLRSDEIRKRLWGRGPKERLPPEAYARAAGETVYETLLETARTCLAAGCAVIADAVFLRADERRAVEEVAASVGVAFRGVWLEAPPDSLRRRVASRRDDASDADERVVDLQLALDPGRIDWLRRPDAHSEEGRAALRATLGLA
jgi:aminoglycoside phosphotransferase family enzyme/predicted kinase